MRDPDDHFPDIRKRFEPLFGWLVHLENCAFGFEDQVNDRQDSLGRILETTLGHGQRKTASEHNAPIREVAGDLVERLEITNNSREPLSPRLNRGVVFLVLPGPWLSNQNAL